MPTILSFTWRTMVQQGGRERAGDRLLALPGPLGIADRDHRLAGTCQATEFFRGPDPRAKVEPVPEARRREQASQGRPAGESPIEQKSRRRAEAETRAGGGG